MIGVVHKDDVQDLKNLISAVDKKLFTAKNLCMINPSFGSASELVGGADADMVMDDTIIDIKTTKKLSLDRSFLDQVLGYYVLHHISGVGELNPKPTITKVAIYFSRYGYVMHLSELIDSATFPSSSGGSRREQPRLSHQSSAGGHTESASQTIRSTWAAVVIRSTMTNRISGWLPQTVGKPTREP